jgi:hypothetical protein
MTGGLRVVGEPADLSLAGPQAGGRTGHLVALGEARADGDVPALRWLDRPPRTGDPAAHRFAAPAGDDLWRRAPWPATDALFDLPAPPGLTVLLAGPPGPMRASIAERAAARGVPLEPVARLDLAGLSRSAAVVLADAPGGALPARAPAVLAAGRLLIVPRLGTAFGLQDGLDHLEFSDVDEAVTLVEAFRTAPDAFARMTLWGRVAARPHRASVVYARLAFDFQFHAPVRGL